MVPRWRKVLAVVAVLSLLATAAVTLGLRARRRGQTPDDASLRAAAKTLASEVQDGDAFAVVPGWSAAQQWRFAEAWRAKGLDFDQAYKLGDPLTIWDVDGHRRLWVLATHGRTLTLSIAPSGGTDLGAARRLSRREMGHGTALELWQLPPSRTVFDFGRRLAEAQAIRDGDSDCTWDGGQFRCPGGGEHWRKIWYFDGEVGDGRHRCVFVQPTRDGAATRLRWSRLPEASELAGHVGLRLWAVRVDEGSDLQFRVRIGDRVAWQTSLAHDDFGWYPFRIALTPSDRGQDVTIELQAERISWRQACFDARLLGPAVGSRRGGQP
jgi:hypothetical protein